MSLESVTPSSTSQPLRSESSERCLHSADGIRLGTPAQKDLQACVVVPVRNEETRLATLIAGLADQRDPHDYLLDADSFEVVLLLNNCTDRTAELAHELQLRYPRLRLHVVEVTLAADEAHVGRARQLLFNTAFARFQQLGKPAGIILTTDADSRPAPNWITQNIAEINKGVDAVGGRILLDREELRELHPGLRRLILVDFGYRRALEEMCSLYAPQKHDPFPRHHQHFGGSFAVTAAAYERAGGMPLRTCLEDIALYQAIVDSGGRVRHSEKARVFTSARQVGRAHGGLSDMIGWWSDQAHTDTNVLVESAAAAETRLRALGRWYLDHPNAIPPVALTATPHQVAREHATEVHRTLQRLRERIEFLRRLPLSARFSDLPLQPRYLNAA